MPRKATKQSTPSAPAKRGRRPGQGPRGSSFARLIDGERKRLQKIRDKVMARKADIDRELEGVERDLRAMGAFLTGGGTSAGRSATGGRARRGERRQQVLDAIKSAPEGATRGDIIRKLNATDPAFQQSISNALAALFKSKAVKRENGRYRAV